MSTITQTKHYQLDCSGGGEYLGAPATARFDIDAATAEFIVRMAAFVKENDLHVVEKFDYRVEWLGTAETERDLAEDLDSAEDSDDAIVPMRSECDCINITEDEFWFSCYRRHLDDEISTSSVSIAELAAEFGIPLP